MFYVLPGKPHGTIGNERISSGKLWLTCIPKINNIKKLQREREGEEITLQPEKLLKLDDDDGIPSIYLSFL